MASENGRPPWRFWDRNKILFSEPVRLTGDPERDALAAALMALEARQGERRGWDQRPQLYSLHLADIDTQAILVRSIPARQWATGPGDTTDRLVAAASRLPAPPERPPYRAFADSPEGFCGVAYMAEAYSTRARLGPAHEQFRAGHPQALADAKATETRMVAAMDINANHYLIQRERGGEPAIHTETLAELHARADARAVHVRLPDALFRIAASLVTGAF